VTLTQRLLLLVAVTLMMVTMAMVSIAGAAGVCNSKAPAKSEKIAQKCPLP